MANIDFSKEPDENDVYPALHHFKIITDAQINCESDLLAAINDHEVRSPLTRGRASSSGKYVSYDLSVFVITREEHHTLHAKIKNINGVKILI